MVARSKPHPRDRHYIFSDSSDDSSECDSDLSNFDHSERDTKIPRVELCQHHDIRTVYDSYLRAIIAVSRLSGKTDDEPKMQRLNDRNGDLSDFAFAIHRRYHSGCHCTPEEHRIILNGVSSNLTTNAADRTQLDQLTQILHNFSVSVDRRQIILIVSTADGFWTNVYSFARFFAPFRALNMTYMIHEGSGRYRAHAVVDVLLAIKDVLRRSGAGETHDLVRQWIQISYAKLFQQQGSRSVKTVVMQQRNTTIIDADSSSCPSLRMDAGMRVVRLTRHCGTDFHPLYTMQEEQRITCRKVHGLLVCPEAICEQTFDNLDQVVAHIITVIMAMPQAHRRCPLCPPESAEWNFLFSIDGIFHILRHLSLANRALDSNRKYQCPHCFILCGSRAHVQLHIDQVHIRALEIRTAAITSGEFTRADVLVNDSLLTRAMATRNRLESMVLPETLRSVARDPAFEVSQASWTTVSTLLSAFDSEPSGSALPECPPFSDATTSGGSALIATTVSSPYQHLPKQQAWYLRYSAGNATANLKQANIVTNGSGAILCPLQSEWQICGCNQYFPTAKELVLHLYQMLKYAEDADKRKCPWCQRSDAILR